jgi:hypothetical protein
MTHYQPSETSIPSLSCSPTEARHPTVGSGVQLVGLRAQQLNSHVSTNDLCPHALEVRDAAALIGVLAVVTGESMLGQLGDDTSNALQRRLVRDGLIVGPASPRELQQALSDLVERIRYALGEYGAPPEPASL